MAVIFREDFNNGNGTVAGAAMGGDNTYDRPPDAQDANYPQIYGTEAVDFSTGSVVAYPSDANAVDAGVAFGDVGDLPGGWFAPHLPYTYLRAPFNFVPAYLSNLISASAGIGTMLYLVDTNALDSLWYPVQLTIEHQGGDTWRAVLDGFGFDGNHQGTWDFDASTIGNVIWEIRWRPGTVTGEFDDVADDGLLQLRVNGVLRIDLQNIDLYLDDHFPTHPINQLRGFSVGFYGLPGTVDWVELGYPSDLPPNDSTPCCADTPTPGTPGTPGVPGPTLGPDPYTPITEWARQCAGGGTVPQAADQTDSESWVV